MIARCNAWMKKNRMDKNKPLKLELDLLKHSNIARNNEYRFITPDFGFINSFASLDSSIFKIGQPYRIKEGRIILPLCGKARISINLIEYDVLPEASNHLLLSYLGYHSRSTFPTGKRTVGFYADKLCLTPPLFEYSNSPIQPTDCDGLD